MKKNGFAVVLSLLLLTTILLLARYLFAHSLLTQQYQQVRHKNVFKQRLCDSVMRYVIAFCTENKKKLLEQGQQKKQIVTLSFARWATINQRIIKADIILLLEPSTVTATIKLTKDHHPYAQDSLVMHAHSSGFSIAPER